MASSGFTVDTTDFARSVRALSARTNKSVEQVLLGSARSTLSNRSGTGMIQIMPPSSGKISAGDARRQGEAAIDRDLSAIFVPKKLLHKRRERWPDVAGIHDARFRSSSRFGKKITRGQTAPYYVDVIKLRALRRLLFARVGWMASSLINACQKLAVRVPAWIARHGSGRGNCEIQMRGPSKYVEISVNVANRAPVAEVERRFVYALARATERNDRNYSDAVQKAARESGFKTSA